jgi:hypothetical protein
MQSQAERNCISNPEQEERRQGRSDQTSQSGQSHVLTSVGFTAHSLLASRKQGRRLPRAVRPSRLRLLDTLLPFLRSHSAVYPLKADKDTSQLAAPSRAQCKLLVLEGSDREERAVRRACRDRHTKRPPSPRWQRLPVPTESSVGPQHPQARSSEEIALHALYT